MSVWRQLKVFHASCAICLKKSEPIFSEYSPSYEELPEGWAYRSLHGCGMTGYSRDEALCPEHAHLAKED